MVTHLRSVIDAGEGHPVLVLDGVERVFRATRGESVMALGKTALSLNPGEFVAIVGASGCGKTTLLKVLGGLLLPTSGTVEYRGKPVTGPIEDLGIVFQRPVLLDWLTVEQNTTLQMRMRQIGTREEQVRRARELLRQVGLYGYETRYPWELSGGQQQRVSLCRALIHQPSLLLMDEPFGALDALTREQLQSDLERLWIEQRPTVVFVTHDVGEAVTLADRVIVMAGRPGRIADDIAIAVPRPRGASLLENSVLQQHAKHVRAMLHQDLARHSPVDFKSATREGD
jgi:NitT/TauT family transport system ATP-binding protein